MTAYEVSFKSSSILAATGLYNVVFTTGPNGAVFTNRTVGFSGSAGSATVYEAPTGVSGGTVQPSYRLDNNRTESAEGVMTAGATVSGLGTQTGATTFYRGTVAPGVSQVGTYSSAANQRKLKPNTTYLLQFVNNDVGAQVIDLYFSWREGR